MKNVSLIVLLLCTVVLPAQQKFDIEGHRGCRGLYPENTIPAFLHAVELGVNTLEMDIVVTKDGKLVISHDPFMNETICSTPDGQPVTDKQKYRLYSMTYDEIKQFDCGSRGNPKFPEQKKMVAHKPLLTEVIDSVEQFVKAHHLPPVYYNIETKSTPEGDDINHPKPAIFTKLFYDVIVQKGVANRCILQSFDKRTLQEIKKLDKNITTAYLIETLKSVEGNIADLGFTPDIYSPIYLMVNKKLIKTCHNMHMKVLPWTVNDEKKMLQLKKMGVDGLITDYPDRAIKVLR